MKISTTQKIMIKALMPSLKPFIKLIIPQVIEAMQKLPPLKEYEVRQAAIIQRPDNVANAEFRIMVYDIDTLTNNVTAEHYRTDLINLSEVDTDKFISDLLEKL